MATLKDMAERLRGIGGDGMCAGEEIMNILGEEREGCPTDGYYIPMACSDCRKKMRGKLADALEAAQQLPEGVEWPRFEDGALVRFGDVFEDKDGIVANMTDVDFHGVKVVVWGLGETAEETARTDGMTVKRPAAKPDTMDAIESDLTMPPWEYCEKHGIEVKPGTDESETVEAMCRHLLARQRKLMGRRAACLMS